MYTLQKIMVVEKLNDTGKPISPVVGYLLQDESTSELFICSRKEAFQLGGEEVFTNAIPKTREVSCKEDALLADEDGLLYYLKLKDDSIKMNTLLLPLDRDLKGVRVTEGFNTFFALLAQN
jgi:hypothetical protein